MFISAPINYWAVAVLMVVSVVLGFIWYGPLFGKKWMALSGIKMPDQKPSFKAMVRPIVISLVGAFCMSFILSYFIIFATRGVDGGLAIAFWIWVGFIVPIYLNFSGWEKKSWTLFFINAGYWLVFILIAGAVLSTWIADLRF